jgi:L-alanine-DL-glutamate epimerase-like enolase superfamily enzyme
VSLSAPVGNRVSSWTHRDAVLVSLRSESVSGIGVAAPLPGFSPDDFATVEAWVDRQAAQLVLSDPAEPSVPQQLVAWRTELPLDAPPSCQFAVESALMQWLVQRAKRPVHTRRFSSIKLSHLLPTDDPERWTALASELLCTTVRVDCVKCKIAYATRSRAQELKAVQSLRAVLGPKVEIRLDANACYSANEARELCALFAGAGASSIEDPCSAEELLTLGTCALPWIADQVLVDDTVAQSVLRADGCAALSLKPALLGGLARTVTLATQATQHNKQLILSHIFDGPVALHALRQLAVLLPEELAPSALAAHSALADWPRAIAHRDQDASEILQGISQYALSAQQWNLHQ